MIQIDLNAKVNEMMPWASADGWAAVEDMLNDLQAGDLAEDQRELWYQFRAICSYRSGDRDEALVRYREGLEQFPGNAQMRFGLGQELERRGLIDEALAVFAEARFPKVSGKWAMVIIRYCFLWGRPEEGFEHLNPVLQAIYEERIIDDHYLYAREIPFFGNLWRTSMALSWQEGSDSLAEARKTLETIAPNLFDPQFSNHDLGYLFQEMDALASGDFGPIIAASREALEHTSEGDGFIGMTALRLALLQAQTLEPPAGRALVEAVRLTEDDFPWLEDVRSLALAQLMAREGRDRDEAELLTTFRERQPLLFEPEHLVYFNLLDYNEKLRERYIAEHLAGG